MYCPKCATENPNDQSYCRGCGEYLTIVAQVLKKSSVLTLVGKMDAVIEVENERLRRDAVVHCFSAVILGVLAFYLANIGALVVLGSGALLSFLFAVLYFLAYRRSLDLEVRYRREGANLIDLDRLPNSSTETSESTTGVSLLSDSIFCPLCGFQNARNSRSCNSCDTDLAFCLQPIGLEKYLPIALVNKLDRIILKNRKDVFSFGGGVGLIAASLFMIVGTIYGLIEDGLTFWTVGMGLFCLTMLPIGVWNLLAKRRALSKHEKSTETLSSPANTNPLELPGQMPSPSNDTITKPLSPAKEALLSPRIVNDFHEASTQPLEVIDVKEKEID